MNAEQSSADRLLPIDELDRNIVSLSALINSSRYELLVLIRQFDERAGWLKWGLSNCAEWLHWRCDLSMSAAREKVRVAHALKTLPSITSAFSSNGEPSAGTSDNYQVTVHVDRSALASGDGRSSLPIESVKRICCDGDAVVIVENENGEPLSVGRKTRTVPTAIKRALQARDKGCVFPGCHHTRFVDAHHIEHWSAGGETSLDNLMLLCSRHHRLVHEGGFRIESDYRNRWFFRRPDGRAVPSCGYQPQDMLDDDIDNGVANNSDTNISTLSTVLHNPSAEVFLTAAKTSVVNALPP